MLDSGHLIYILLLGIVVLIIWGPNKLPEVGSGLGSAIREFRKATQDTQNSLRSVMNEPPAPPSAAAPTPPVAVVDTPAVVAAPVAVAPSSPAPDSSSASPVDEQTQGH